MWVNLLTHLVGPTFLFFIGCNNQSDMAGAFVNLEGTSLSTWTVALHGWAFINECFADKQLVFVEGQAFTVCFIPGVGYCGGKYLAHRSSCALLLGEFQNGQGFIRLLTTNKVDDAPGLHWRNTQVACNCLGFHCLILSKISQPRLAAAFLVVLGVAAEGTRWREFSQFVSDHGFGNEHRHVLATIVNSNGVTQHVRDDHRTTSPSADNVFRALFVLSKNLQVQVLIYVGALLQAAWHLRSAPIDSSCFSDDDAQCTVRWPSSDGECDLRVCPSGWTGDVHRRYGLHHHRVGDPQGS